MREENGESKNWGKHGNLDLHSWAFDRFTEMLIYKAQIEGIEIEQVSERDTLKSCSCCVASERRTVSNAGCTCAMSAVRWRTLTRMVLRIFDRKHLRVYRVCR